MSGNESPNKTCSDQTSGIFERTILIDAQTSDHRLEIRIESPFPAIITHFFEWARYG